MKDVRPGMKLAIPVLHPRQATTVLLKEGFALSEASISRLQQLRLDELWIQYPGLEMVRSHVSPSLVRQRAAYTDSVRQVLDAYRENMDATIDWTKYDRSMTNLINELIADQTASTFIEGTMCEHQSLMRHSTSVSFLAAVLGLKLEGYLVRQRKRVASTEARNIVGLGKGAMLHDIGLSMIDPQVFAEWSQQPDENDAKWREHIDLGYKLVSGKVESATASIVKFHHQYFDGSGFPSKTDWEGKTQRVSGDQIHIFTRIVTVADHFDELRFGFDGTTRPAVRVLRMMASAPLVRRFDPVILKALFATVPAYAPGQIVRLSTGQAACVVDWDPERPCRPQLALIDDPEAWPENLEDAPARIINLAAHPRLYISEVEGHNVSRDNFDSALQLIQGSAEEGESLTGRAA